MHRDANKIIPISFIMDDVVVSDVPIRKKKHLMVLLMLLEMIIVMIKMG